MTTGQDTTIDGTIERTWHAALGEESWDAVMADSARLVDAHGFLIQAISRHVPGEAGNEVLAERGFGPEAMRTYFRHYMDRNVWAANRDVMVPGAVVTSSMLYPDRQLPRTEYYHGWLRPLDIFYALGGVAWQDAESIIKVTLVRSGRRLAFGDRERQVAEALMPHFRTALRVHRRLRRVEALVSPLVAAIDEMPNGVLVLGSALQVLHANRSAREALVLSRSASLREGVLRCVDHRTQQLLEQLAAGDRRAWALSDAAPLLLPSPAGRPLQALLVPLPRQHGAAQQFVLFLRDALAPAAPPDASLVALFGLSRAETALARALAEGKSLEEIATERGVARSTVRHQFRTAAAKLGVHKQSELILCVTGLLRRHAAPGWPVDVP